MRDNGTSASLSPADGDTEAEAVSPPTVHGYRPELLVRQRRVIVAVTVTVLWHMQNGCAACGHLREESRTQRRVDSELSVESRH